MTRHQKPEFEYSTITRNLIIGTNQCCIAHFRKELLAKGVQADISLEDRRVDAPIGVKHFLWLPVKDHHAPTKSQLELGVASLHYLAANKVKTYVHCTHGHGRAPTLVAAYLISTGMKPMQAINFINAKRPGAHLTERQIEALKKYARRLKR